MNYLFTFVNTHQAIHAEDVFEAHIPIRVMPLPSQLGDACGICLRVADKDLAQAKALLAEAAIETASIYEIDTTHSKKVYTKCC